MVKLEQLLYSNYMKDKLLNIGTTVTQ